MKMYVVSMAQYELLEKTEEYVMWKLGYFAVLHDCQWNPQLLDGCQSASVPTTETNLLDYKLLSF